MKALLTTALVTISALVSIADAQSAEALDRHCRAQDDFSGVVLVERDGEVIFHEGYGVDTDTRFYVGSVAKVFTATAALRLDAQGVVSIDEPIGSYLGDVPEDKSAITLRHLLTHTSGLTRRHPNPLERLDRDAFVEWILATPLEFEPGEAWEYSNAGYSLTAAVIEKAASAPFERVMREQVFGPAGMKSAEFVDELDGDDDVAVGSGPLAAEHGLDGDPRTYAGTWLRMGAGGIVLTAADLLAFDRALRSGALLTEAQRRETATPVRDGWGTGWRLSRTRHGDPMRFHDGSFPGFNSGYAHVENGCLIILCNREEAVAKVQGPALDLLIGE